MTSKTFTQFICDLCGTVSESLSPEYALAGKGWVTIPVKKKKPSEDYGNDTVFKHVCPECDNLIRQHGRRM